MGVYAEQLALVRTAIRKVLESGQQVSYNGRSWRPADITTLRSLEKEYETLAAQEESKCAKGARIIYVTPYT